MTTCTLGKSHSSMDSLKFLLQYVIIVCMIELVYNLLCNIYRKLLHSYRVDVGKMICFIPISVSVSVFSFRFSNSVSVFYLDPLSIRHFLSERSRLANQKLRRSREWAGNKARREVALNPSIK